MKINPLDKLQSATRPAAVQPKDRNPGPGFAAVLEKKVEQSAGSPKPMHPAASPMGPLVRMVDGSGAERTGELLDHLETYQQMLADPHSSLRDIAPVVDALRRASDHARRSMGAGSADDPAGKLIRETVLVIEKEIARFDLGMYIEE